MSGLVFFFIGLCRQGYSDRRVEKTTSAVDLTDAHDNARTLSRLHFSSHLYSVVFGTSSIPLLNS